MNKKTIIITAIVLVGLGAAWYFTKPKTKEQMMQYLIDKGYHHNIADLRTFDEAFIKAWYTAAKNGLTQFRYGNYNINVQGGSQVK